MLRDTVHPAFMTTQSDQEPDVDWVPSTDDFGARLALVRQRKNWNISEAAKACGLAETTWHTWEEGSYPRKMEQVCRAIAKASGVNYVWLMTGQTGRDFAPAVNSDRAHASGARTTVTKRLLSVTAHPGETVARRCLSRRAA
jgi:transcriptional regulator with XRE-family HTH domain